MIILVGKFGQEDNLIFLDVGNLLCNFVDLTLIKSFKVAYVYFTS